MVKNKGQAGKRRFDPLLALQPVKPQLIEEVWVQCDKPSCKKWRKLPPGSKAPPENAEWFCSMNPDPYRNSCDIPEEDWDEEEDKAQQQLAANAAALQQPAYSKGLMQQQQPYKQQFQQQPQQHSQQQRHQQQHQQQQQHLVEAPPAKRRRSSDLQYAAADYEWEGLGKKKRRKSVAPPQQLPHFFVSKEEEEEQLVVACQRIMENGGLWDPAATAPSAAAAVTGQPLPSSGHLALPLWVWNGLHTHAAEAASLLVDALDLLTSSISIDMHELYLPTNGKQQQQQQSVVEQRWRFARVALLAAACSTLAVLKPDVVEGLPPAQPLHFSSDAAPPPAAVAAAMPSATTAPATAALGPSDSAGPELLETVQPVNPAPAATPAATSEQQQQCLQQQAATDAAAATTAEQQQQPQQQQQQQARADLGLQPAPLESVPAHNSPGVQQQQQQQPVAAAADASCDQTPTAEAAAAEVAVQPLQL